MNIFYPGESQNRIRIRERVRIWVKIRVKWDIGLLESCEEMERTVTTARDTRAGLAAGSM